MKSIAVRPLSVLTLSAAVLSGCGDQLVTGPHPGSRIVPAPRASLADVGIIEAPIVEGQIVVRFRSGADVEGEAAASGAEPGRELAIDRTWLLSVPVGQEVAVAESMTDNPAVEFAEPDYLTALEPCGLVLCDRPTDGFFGYKWDLHNNGTIKDPLDNLIFVTGRPDADIDWFEMFTALGGDAFTGTATVGILDSGIRDTHQDLAGRVTAQRNFATGYPAELIEDRDGHGTHVAGIAAGRGNNGVGTSGVAYAPNIKIINAKVCERYLFPDDTVRTSCPSSSQAEAIVWATDNGANVLNMSLGGPATATAGAGAVQIALQYARSRNVLVFCSAGNANYPEVGFPGRFPECVSVGATDWGDNRASYSNYGAKVALSAPGGDGESLPSSGASLILSADFGASNRYSWKAGTSMSAPAAAGLAAMLYASGMTDDDEVLERMQSTADDLGPEGRDPEFGFGRINAYRALTLSEPIDPPIAEIFRQSATTARVGQPFHVFGRFTDKADDGPWSYDFAWGDGTTSTVGRVTTPPTRATLQFRSKTFLTAGRYTVRYTVRDREGLIGYAERVVTVVP